MIIAQTKAFDLRLTAVQRVSSRFGGYKAPNSLSIEIEKEKSLKEISKTLIGIHDTLFSKANLPPLDPTNPPGPPGSPPPSSGHVPQSVREVNTSALLPPEGNRQDIKSLSSPEDDLDNYHRERLQQGLRHIDNAAERKITPRTQELLKIHEDACKVALGDETPDEAARVVVQALDKVYYSGTFCLKPRSTEEYDRPVLYVKLRRLKLLVNYGDYLGHELQFFPALLKVAAIGDDAEITEAAYELGPKKTWVTIADELAGTDVNDLRRHVAVACGVLGIDSEHML